MLATLTDERFADPGWIFERKLDGEGCLAFGDEEVRLLSRNRRLLNGAYPHRVGDGERFYRQACRSGWEGLITKRAASPYVHRRSPDWLKFKCVAEQELVVGGWTDPEGGRTDFGALLVGYYDGAALVYAGKVGTGYDEATLRARLRRLARPTSPFARGNPPAAGAHWVEPVLVAEVGFSEWTSAGKLRHPRYLGLRPDKPAREVVRETLGPARRRRP